MRLICITFIATLFSCSYEKDPLDQQIDNDKLYKEAVRNFKRTDDTTSKFNKYLSGRKNALSKEEKIGLKLFMDAKCTFCHAGKDLGAGNYQMLGIHEPYWKYTGSEEISKGLYDSTGKESDKFMFKIPAMRDSVMSPPYLFDNSINSLDSVIKIMAKIQAFKELSDKETELIKEFLETL